MMHLDWLMGLVVHARPPSVTVYGARSCIVCFHRSSSARIKKLVFELHAPVLNVPVNRVYEGKLKAHASVPLPMSPWHFSAIKRESVDQIISLKWSSVELPSVFVFTWYTLLLPLSLFFCATRLYVLHQLLPKKTGTKRESWDLNHSPHFSKRSSSSLLLAREMRGYCSLVCMVTIKIPLKLCKMGVISNHILYILCGIWPFWQRATKNLYGKQAWFVCGILYDFW